MNQIDVLARCQVRSRGRSAGLGIKRHDQVWEGPDPLAVRAVHRHVLVPERHLKSGYFYHAHIKAALTA